VAFVYEDIQWIQNPRLPVIGFNAGDDDVRSFTLNATDFFSLPSTSNSGPENAGSYSFRVDCMQQILEPG
jgi:hypothetical protein